VFRYLLKSPDGVLHNPGVVVTAVPFWSLAETLQLGNGQLLRILAIDTEIHHALIEAGINGVFTVEPASKGRGLAVTRLFESGIIRLRQRLRPSYVPTPVRRR
jgi:hypothetical protein